MEEPGRKSQDVADGRRRDETYRLLEAGGLGDVVMVGFGIIRDLDYYTGPVTEICAPGIGFPLGAGGRYDALLVEFGAPIEAAGFAFGMERLHIAISEQGEVITGEMRAFQIWAGR